MTEPGEERGFNPSTRLRSMRGGGQEYLDVKWRWVWLDDDTSRGMEEAVGYTAHSECLQISDTFALFKATVAAIRADGTIIRETTGHGSETKGDFGDFIEKAETKAMGRALQHLGYGSAAAADDGDRVADAPVDRRAAQRPAPGRTAPPAQRPAPAQQPRNAAPAPAQGDAPAPAAGRNAAPARSRNAAPDRLAAARELADERGIADRLPLLVAARFPAGVQSEADAAALTAWLGRYDADGWTNMLPHVTAINAAPNAEALRLAGEAAQAAGIGDDDLRACWVNRRNVVAPTQPQQGAAA